MDLATHKVIEAVEAYGRLLLSERQVDRASTQLFDVLAHLPSDNAPDYLVTTMHLNKLTDAEVHLFDIPAFLERIAPAQEGDAMD